ncbi:dihydrodipicolinate synthase family protein (plasmid) [Sphingomonas aliaeris]|uniref:Dihydrodipicolinate synthase family protein n=1 Tax=Sphingomonas aliaeris TaxID=2759526 RepID=A0A974NZ73_9SPHN|nr:dihydrodipicolinate synthase family protein [Sphingomonas aliaeris]QQV79387.1 dihydrodipicolinate synthase family protein [Sphingomonas aliaeris]
MSKLFTGLSAFPLTPANTDGVVDTAALGLLIDRLVTAGVDSIGLLGSTGIYAYLDRHQRKRAVAAAVEAASGHVPLIVGVGALRTSWAIDLARDAERAGASGLLLAPVSYASLTDGEAAAHYRAVAGTTALPLCVYNNPGTTNFTFSDALIAELAAVPGIAAIKMPLPADDGYAGELARLRATTPETFAIGYSGDWGAAPSLLAGGDAWYSVVAGLLPEPALRLTRAAQDGVFDEAAAINAAFAPLWSLFKAHGSLRLMYAIADLLSLQIGDPPLPIMRVGADVVADVGTALDHLGV